MTLQQKIEELAYSTQECKAYVQLPPEMAEEWAKTCGTFNSMDQSRVLALIQKINRMANAAKEKCQLFRWYFLVGIEFSPVIYAVFAPDLPFNWTVFSAHLKVAGNAAKADESNEVEIHGWGPLGYDNCKAWRFWWD